MIETLLSQVLGKPEREWPGLFKLYRDPDGSTRVELGSITAPCELALRWKLDEQERELASALVMLSVGVAALPIVKVPEPMHQVPFGGSNVFEIHEVAKALHGEACLFRNILSKLNVAFGDDLSAVTDVTRSRAERRRAKTKIESRVSHVLDALISKGSRKAHARSTVVKAYFGEAPLAWSVLEATKKLVAKDSELPSKKAVKKLMIKSKKSLSSVSSPQWAAAFREAGLSSLPKASSRMATSRE